MNQSKTEKINITQLAAILRVTPKTAKKHYKDFLFILKLERDFLIRADLQKLEIFD